MIRCKYYIGKTHLFSLNALSILRYVVFDNDSTHKKKEYQSRLFDLQAMHPDKRIKLANSCLP